MPSVLNPQPWLDALARGDEEARKRATMAIGSFPLKGRIDVGPFVSALSSPDVKLVFWSVIGLGRSQSQAAQAVSALSSLAQGHPAFGIRQAAISALRDIAPGEAISRSATFQALRDSNAFVRREALQSIAAYPSISPTEVQLVRHLAGDPDESVVNWSAIVLRHHNVLP